MTQDYRRYVSAVAGFALLPLAIGCGAGNFGSTTASNSALTTTTLAVSPSSVTSGMAVKLSATVSPGAAGGTVTFLDGTTSVGTGTVSGGQASASVSNFTKGTHAITASYGGTTGYFASSSTAVNVYVSAMLSASSITLTASPTSGSVGTNVLLAGTVNSGATGVVTFYDGSTSLGSALLSGTSASYSTAMLTAGAHTLTAVYGGSTSYAGATSAAVIVTLR